MKIMTIAGARPNFMKVASIIEAVNAHNDSGDDPHIEHILVHTGQHYDQKLSQCFFQELGIPEPDINLEVGSGSHAVQTAEIMKRFEPVLLEEQPDILVVVGDVNSTVACTLVASKIIYPSRPNSNTGNGRIRPIIAHVEAGLRSFDRGMPEEINRILTDALSDILFLTEEDAVHNLKAEGVAREKMVLVGNVMIDTLNRHLSMARNSDVIQRFSIPSRYALVTMHRPSNVDTIEALKPLINCLTEISQSVPLVFPVHPRTRNALKRFQLLTSLEQNSEIQLLEPLSYLDFLNLLSSAVMVLTDSGGIQEETTALHIPCITMRENTERPVTVTMGTNYLTGTDPAKILSTAQEILCGKGKKGKIPPYWDGRAGERIIKKLIVHLTDRDS